MNERLNLTEEQMSRLRRVESGNLRSLYLDELKPFLEAGLVVASSGPARGLKFVSITHKGRRVALGMAPEQGDDE